MKQKKVAVVGSGIVGATLAYHLVQKGFYVEVFERGPEYSYPHSEQFKEEFEYLYKNPGYSLPEDVNNIIVAGDYQHPLNGDFYAVVGGSSTRWSGIALRMIPSDFKTKSLYGYGDDWPISYEAIEPYYCRAESFIGVSGTDEDNPFAPPRSQSYPMPPFELSYDDLILAERLKDAGMVLHSTPQARTRVQYGDRQACDNNGPCWVCPIGARYSPNYHLQKAVLTGSCRVVSGVTVRRIVADASGRATGIVYQDNESSTEQEHAADIVIVAANAIESARLLLLSKNERHPNGIGNHSGQLGKNLTFHHGWLGNVRYKEKFYPSRFGGWTGQSHQFMNPPSRGRHGGTKIEFPFVNEPPNIIGATWNECNTGEDVIASMEESRHWVPIRFHSEASVGSEKFVALSEEKDRFGDPFAKAHYSLNEFDHETYAFVREILDKMVSATHADEVSFSSVEGVHSIAHHHGTCRMGDSPNTSVVDSYGQVHGISNLFLAGGSTFVGSATVNPTLTMVALGIRTSDYIIEKFKS
ncbi:GMC family oxidoreductase [Leptolyngbya sp. KIOST-1]|uniref:GMC family oxidoreductase n=1 Tax=Leptolyngbya sp. KIOST-1 TaxID=1229172 RepID=UPI000907CD11|nr:GMC family oxidoreductase [Leptolyngbya sp. KIOST-1]